MFILQMFKWPAKPFLLTSRIETFQQFSGRNSHVEKHRNYKGQPFSAWWPTGRSKPRFPALSRRTDNKALGFPATSSDICANEMGWCKQQCVTVRGYVCNQVAWCLLSTHPPLWEPIQGKLLFLEEVDSWILLYLNSHPR